MCFFARACTKGQDTKSIFANERLQAIVSRTKELIKYMRK